MLIHRPGHQQPNVAKVYRIKLAQREATMLANGVSEDRWCHGCGYSGQYFNQNTVSTGADV